MAGYVTGFVLSDVAALHRYYAQAQTDIGRLETRARGSAFESLSRDAADRLQKSYGDFQHGLSEIARVAAAEATAVMEARLDERVRAATGNAPGLKALAYAEPLGTVAGYETGSVGLGDLQALSRAINRISGGRPYWRAIEYGTGAGPVPSQVGRVIYGSFVGNGPPDAPDARYRGGGGPHPAFQSYTKGAQGRNAKGSGKATGLGTIRHEVRGKHYISEAERTVGEKWLQMIAQLQQKCVNEISAIMDLLRS